MTMTIPELLDGLIAAWRSGDALRAAAYFAEDATYQEARHEPVLGREAIAAHFVRFFRDGPLWRFDIDATIVDGNRAAIAYRFAVKGATDAWRERAGCAIIQTAGGLLSAWREYEG